MTDSSSIPITRATHPFHARAERGNAATNSRSLFDSPLPVELKRKGES